MTAPDFMPVLAHGSHHDPREGACVMEYVSILAGERFTDRPQCTHPVLAEAARCVNDHLQNSDRHLLVPLIGRLIGTADVREDETQCRVLSVRLAVFAARFALRWVREQDRAVCVRAIEAAEQWADEPSAAAANAHVAAANAAAYAAHAAASNAAYVGANVANAAAYVAHAAAYANAAAAAYANAAAANAAAAAGDAAANAAAAGADDAANAAAAAGADDVVALLEGLLDEHQRLTGHTPRGVTADELTSLAAATA